ncbi:MAG: HAMP domain-containing protein [Goleter apudmare HA4340-LM2]|jgi:signal transduction histidine kinase|nr:HAMP domain-containing protein [Goleter apudmare HA4340-LM2]
MIRAKKNNFKVVLTWFSRVSNNWSITQKISYGYAAAIGIALTGTISGLLLAYYYETQAHKQLNLSYQQQSLLKDLENAVIRIRLHPQRLVTVIDSSIWLEFEKNKFLDDLTQVNEQISQLETFVNNHPNDLALNIGTFHTLLHNYKSTTKSYDQVIKSFWQQTEKNKLSSENRKYSYSDIMTLLRKERKVNLNVNFEQLSDELIRIIGHAEIQKQQANISFNSAQKLRIKVITVSMVTSVLLAVILALYTSKLIARPLQEVTKVAKKITQESNFQLKANVVSSDEVGILAKSLNQLVEWVGDYTKELELARQTLEHRVEERTQELQQAHQTLEHRVEERTQELQEVLQDLKQTQGQLIQTEKMSSLGQMVAGIAHEINNPVNFIYGNLQCADEYIQELLNLVNLYQQEYPEPSCIIAETIEEIDLNFLSKDLSNLLSSMKIGSQRIREIVLSLRNFSRLDEAAIKEVDIHEGIDSTLLILNHRIQSDIAVIKNYGTLPLIECYPAQLNQVFMNIISNAMDALLDQKSAIDKHVIITTSRLDENYIQVAIKDNGVGIPSEIINKLFDPFFTTKPVGQGTGLGLSICYQIVDKHQGRIEVISVVNQGTEFLIKLPIKAKLN